MRSSLATGLSRLATRSATRAPAIDESKSRRRLRGAHGRWIASMEYLPWRHTCCGRDHDRAPDAHQRIRPQDHHHSAQVGHRTAFLRQKVWNPYVYYSTLARPVSIALPRPFGRYGRAGRVMILVRRAGTMGAGTTAGAAQAPGRAAPHVRHIERCMPCSHHTRTPTASKPSRPGLPS